MPFEHYEIPAVHTGSVLKRIRTAEEFGQDVASIYEKVKNAGGKVVAHHIVDSLSSPGAHDVTHAVIIADIPDEPPVLSDVTPAGLWESELPGSGDFPE